MTVIATIDSAGITVPSYDEMFVDLLDQFKLIYGFDTYLEPDAKDLQMLAIFARATHDANLLAASVYNSFSPTSAVGAGLSNLVKINGLRRKIPSYSSVAVKLIGVAGTIIDNGAVSDGLGSVWLLPAQVVIPITGEITVTATARDAGAITAAVGTITHIETSVPGWQEVTNTSTGTGGAPVESDAELRRRQMASTAISSRSPVAAIWGGLLDLDGVIRVAVLQNDTDVPDSNGIPDHSIAAIVEGGEIDEIASVIANTKSPGTGTFGSTTVVATDRHGIPNTINFFVLTEVPIYFRVAIRPLAGYLATVAATIRAAMAAHFNELTIGEPVYQNRLWAPAALSGGAAVRGTGLTQEALDRMSDTYNIVSIEISLNNIHFYSGDLQLPFTSAAVSDPDKGVVTIDATVPLAAPGGIVYVP